MAVTRRQKIEEIARRQQGVDIILERDIGHPRLGGMSHRAAQFLLGHHLVGHRLDHLGPGDEHVG